MERERYLNYIAGEWIDGEELAEDINPSDTSEVIAEYVRSDRQQTKHAIEAASGASSGWADYGVQARSDLLDKIGNELLRQKTLLVSSYPGKKEKRFRKALVRLLEQPTFLNSSLEKFCDKQVIYCRPFVAVSMWK